MTFRNERIVCEKPYFYGSPAWSPDSKQIASMAQVGDPWSWHKSSVPNPLIIYIINIDGSGKQCLTADGSNNSNPLWSPDGKKIIFQSDRDGDFEIFMMNMDGTEQTQLTFNKADDCCPSCSPVIQQEILNMVLRLAFIIDHLGELT